MALPAVLEIGEELTEEFISGIYGGAAEGVVESAVEGVEVAGESAAEEVVESNGVKIIRRIIAVGEEALTYVKDQFKIVARWLLKYLKIGIKTTRDLIIIDFFF